MLMCLYACVHTLTHAHTPPQIPILFTTILKLHIKDTQYLFVKWLKTQVSDMFGTVSWSIGKVAELESVGSDFESQVC